MSTVAPLQSNFSGGEISPLLYGRVDSDRYKTSLALCHNWIPTLQGGLTRRPGSQFIGAVKDGTTKVRIIPFTYSTTQAYMLEFGYTSGSGYIRFWANYGLVTSSGPYEITHPYLAAELPSIRYVQSADVLYLVHPAHPPMKLERFGATDWVLAKISFVDGPYLPIADVVPSVYSLGISDSTQYVQNVVVAPNLSILNTSNAGSGLIRCRLTTSTAGLTSGMKVKIVNCFGCPAADGVWTISVVDQTQFDLLGSAFTSYSGGPSGSAAPAVFASTDVGRHFRFQSFGGPNWGWGIITAFTDEWTAEVTCAVLWSSDVFASYAFGVYSDTNGYPSNATFHQDRLCLSGLPSFPQRIDASFSSDYERFSPSNFDGSVDGSNALAMPLNATDVNAIQWLNSDEKGLLSGSVSNEWIIRPSLNSEALTATNIAASRVTRWGSANINALQVSRATMFVQRGGRKVRELQYFFDIDGYRATDLTELAEHITGGGVIDMAYQAIVYPTLWFVRNDGALIGLTYERELGVLRTGWHQHTLGGVSDAAGSPATVEGIAVIPSPDGVRDDPWMVVQRYVNGSVVRYLEVLTKVFETGTSTDHAFNLDCGNIYDAPTAITSITNANPTVVTCAGHGLSSGDKVKISGVLGMLTSLGSGITAINGNVYQVTVINSSTFSLDGFNSTANTPYVSGGVFRKLVSTISGLTYLEGETVSIWADGQVQPSQVVSNTGQITLTSAAAVVVIGYPYNSDGQTLRQEAGSRNGTSLGKTRRLHRAGFMLYQAQGLSVGRSFDQLDPLPFPSSDLFSGILSANMEFDYDFDNQMCFRVSSPQPCVLSAIMQQMQTQDRA